MFKSEIMFQGDRFFNGHIISNPFYIVIFPSFPASLMFGKCQDFVTLGQKLKKSNLYGHRICSVNKIKYERELVS